MTVSRQPTGIAVTGLTVLTASGEPVLDGIDLHAPAGAALAVLGASGAGKTTLALTLLGHLREGLRHTRGHVQVDGHTPLRLRGRALRRYRRSVVAWLGQEPAAALTPTRRVGALIGDAAPAGHVPGALAAVGLPTEPDFLRRFPHELSGGQRRRVALARALARQPRLLVLDEPLAGLDSAARDQVLEEIDRARRAVGAGLLLVTHDVHAARAVADQLVVVDRGRLVATGSADTGLGHLTSVAAAPRVTRARAGQPRVAMHTDVAALAVTDLHARHPGALPVVTGFSLTLSAGECVALIGPSGVGKSTLIRAVLGLHPPDRGRVELAGTVLALSVRDRTPAQRRALGWVPQDPATSLHPARTIQATLAMALRNHGSATDPGWPSTVEQLLRAVGLDATLGPRRPDALSGGQRQRVALARALAGRPRVLLADEITSALDGPTAANLLDLLDDLRRHHGLAILLVTHDPDAARRVADRVQELPRTRRPQVAVTSNAPTAGELPHALR